MMKELMVLLCCFVGYGLTGLVAPVQQQESRIVNGQIDQLNRFPWHVSLEVSYLNSPVNYCGGSIISEWFVLTSASCIYNSRSIKINMGSQYRLKPAKTLTSTLSYVHPQYNSYNFQNNIALVKLPSALVFSSTLNAVRLVSRSQETQNFLAASAYLSGYGVTSNTNKTLSERLQFTRQRVISNHECQSHFDPQMVQVPQMCTVGWDNAWQAGCFGDGGGPLVIDECGVWTQLAVMSFIHVNGCENGRPTGFTRVASYYDWISKIANYAFRP